jgi:membrane-associated phospholipid phosphatase
MLTKTRVTLVALAAVSFAVLAALAAGAGPDWLTAADDHLQAWSDRHRTDRRGDLASGLWATLGSPLNALIAAVAGGGLVALRARSPMPVILVMGAVGAGVAVATTLKAMIPPHGFPSGHVTVTMTLLGMIAVGLAAGDSPLAKAAVGILVAQSVLFVVALAVYTGAHTLTDAIGGILLGGGIVALGAAVTARPPRRPRTPARAAVGVRPEPASPGRRSVPAPDATTHPLRRR